MVHRGRFGHSGRNRLDVLRRAACAFTHPYYPGFAVPYAYAVPQPHTYSVPQSNPHPNSLAGSHPITLPHCDASLAGPASQYPSLSQRHRDN